MSECVFHWFLKIPSGIFVSICESNVELILKEVVRGVKSKKRWFQLYSGISEWDVSVFDADRSSF